MRFSFEQKQFIETNLHHDKKAVVGSDMTLSWSAFKIEVEKLVNSLENLAIPKGHPVLIFGHKEAHFIVAKTALMIYGCPYVPADIIFPFERIKMMQEECQSQVLINLTSDNTLNDSFTTVISLPTYETSSSNEVTSSLNHLTTSDNPIVYVLFTSGSTGRPKGVPITAKGVNSLAKWVSSAFNIYEKDVILNVSALSFDFASFEEYLFLSLGNTIVLSTNEEIKASNKMLEKIENEETSVWVSTPSLVYMYLMEPRFCEAELPFIKSFVFAGESLPLRTVQKLQERFPMAKIWNAYGPTEATNLTAAVELSAKLVEEHKAIPIGYVKPDAEISLLNEDQEGIGEICIIGDHVTNGYLNNEALNNEKFFIQNGKKAYKSGDLGFFKDGLLFYAGRNDEMVKLHGFRIELEDISSQIKSLEKVLNASTIGLKNKGETKKIISFFTAKEKLSSEEIKTALLKNLPEYMIPSEIIQLEEIPLNVSDKIDKKMLEQIYFEKKA